MNTREISFISHILRYIGVGMISGSIVHAGTLGGSITKYIILIVLGIIFFILGNIIEYRKKFDKTFLIYILVSTIVSIGTGMVSGGTQHYLDNPIFGSMIIGLGLIIAYVSFTYRDFKDTFSQKHLAIVIFASIIIASVLYFIGSTLPKNDRHITGHMNLLRHF